MLMNDGTQADSHLLQEMIDRLTVRYGEIMSAKDAWRELGFASEMALHRAYSRRTFDLHMFHIQGRRGRYALSRDVASWIMKQRSKRPDNAEIL